MADRSKDFRLALLAYTRGWLDNDGEALDTDLAEQGAAKVLAIWKQQTGGRKPAPDHIELARTAWKKAGQPADGVVFQGHRYHFEPDGDYDVTKNLMANFPTAK